MPYSQNAQTRITHHACLFFVSVHQMAPPLVEVPDIQLQLSSHLSTRRDERLSWPGWLTYSGRFNHISGHPSAAGRAQDREVRRPKTDVIPLCHVTNSSTSFAVFACFQISLFVVQRYVAHNIPRTLKYVYYSCSTVVA